MYEKWVAAFSRFLAFNSRQQQAHFWLILKLSPIRAQKVQGYRHLLTFSDEARMCLGNIVSPAFLGLISALSGICGNGV
jgi:hypothetical protein